MAEKIKTGAWRHQAAIIYKRAPGAAYEDDKRIGWAGGHDEAEKICKEHNKEVELIIKKTRDGNVKQGELLL